MTHIGGWLFFGLLCVFFELLSPGFFYCLSLALGTLPAACGAWFELSFGWQTGLFFGGSLISFFLLYVCVRKVTRIDGHYRSAVDALPGKKGVIVEKVSSTHIGQVRVEGQLWAAQSMHDDVLEKGAPVLVIRVEGVRLIVTARNAVEGDR